MSAADPFAAASVSTGPDRGVYPETKSNNKIPMAVKVLYTTFLAVLVPVYWSKYGPTNFLYFCDVALFLALIGVWWEKRIFASMAAVGILLPQMLWVVDFAGNFAGVQLTGITNYMFDEGRSLFLRGLSLFHGWLPFLLVFMVWRLGYDKRAIIGWTVTAWVLVLISYLVMPAPGAELANPMAPANINYVYGFSDTVRQAWLPQNIYVLSWKAVLLTIVYLPTHFTLKKLFGRTEFVPV